MSRLVYLFNADFVCSCLASSQQWSHGMYITNSPGISAANRLDSSRTTQVGAEPESFQDAGIEKTVRPLDLSHVTPRQLLAYINEMTFSGQLSLDDGGALFGAIPGEWYEECPDTPIDLKSTVKGIMEFDRDNGYDALAAFYAGLMERMTAMEDRSLRLSVMA